MKHSTLKKIVLTAKKADNKEWCFALSKNVIRTKHDSGSYDKGSDVETAQANYSVKSSAFTLMSGSLCEGLEDFNDIWNLYESRVHSNVFVYITEEYEAYEMNIHEFKRFVYTFCKIERESAKNGGQMKIRCRKESEKMLRWLEERAA